MATFFFKLNMKLCFRKKYNMETITECVVRLNMG